MTDLISQNASIIANLCLLLMLTLVGILVLSKQSKPSNNKHYASGLIGAVFGAAVVLSLNMSFEISTGVITDLRTLPALMSGALGGPVAAVVAGLIGSAGRVYLGGAGWLSGVLNIVIPSLAGFVLWRATANSVKPLKLRYFAIAVAACGLLAIPVGLATIPVTRDWGLALWLEFVGIPTSMSLTALVLMGSVWSVFQRLQASNSDLINSLSTQRESLSESNEALSASHEKLQLAMRCSGVGLWEWNPTTGETWVDERWREMLGYTVEEIKPTVESWSDKLHPDDMEECLNRLWAHIEGQTEFYESTHRMRHKDGHWITVKDVGSVTERDSDGRVVRFLGSHQDVTDLVQDYRDAARSLQQLNDIVVAGRIGLFMDHIADSRFEANQTFRDIFELPEAEFPVLQRALMDIRYHPDFVEGYITERDAYLASAINLKSRRILRMPDGREKHIVISAHIERQAGKAVAVVGSVLDQTQDVLRQRELEQTAKEKSDLLNAVKFELRREQLASELGYGCKWELDLTENRIRPDKALARWYGPRWVPGEWYPAEELLLAIPEEWQENVDQQMRDATFGATSNPADYLFQTQYPFNRNDTGQTIWLKVYGRVTRFDGRNVFVGQSIDITEEHKQREQLLHLAFHDELTDLPNREKAQSVLTAWCEQQNCTAAVVKVGIKQFRHYNNIFGAKFGDQLLIKVANLLRDCVGNDKLLFRGPGGVFIILLKNVERSDELDEFCQQLLQRFETELAGTSDDLARRLVLGAVLGDKNSSSPEMVMQEAEMALSIAKRQQAERYVFYKPEMRDLLNRRLVLQEEMSAALNNREFELLYQPQYDVRQHKFVGAEALIRWNHPQRGIVSPAEFIPIAEESDLIVDISRWVLDAACAQARAWERMGWDRFKVSVNLSAKHFESRTIDADIQSALVLNELNPELLELELTESAVFDSLESTKELLESWSKQGISIAIDDFGTGYSNLATLLELPIDKLKIDQSFVREFSTNKSKRIVVQTTALLAKSLKLSTVVEGVETKAVMDALAAMGCHVIQGYVISKPVSADKIESLVAAKCNPSA